MAEKIGFIGLGLMGEQMAKRLLQNGFHLFVFNRTREKIEKLGKERVTPVSSPSEIPSNCEIAISMVSDSKALEEISLGENGLLAGVRENFIHIDMSTVSPKTTKKLYEIYKGKKCQFLHAPVLGSRQQAGDGTLLIFAGGDKSALERGEKVLKVLGKKIWHFEDVEKATTLKLAMNSMIAMMIVALSQAFILAEKSGIPKNIILEILEGSALNSPMYQTKGGTIIDKNYTANFYVKHILKDINLALERAEELKIPLPALSAIRELFITAMSRGYENEDYSSVYKIFEELSGLKS